MDNGGEFIGAANDSTGIHMHSKDDFIDQVIKEVKNIWPKVLMVQGFPQHLESKVGVKGVNQMVQVKLAGWIKQKNSKHWAIGAKFCQAI